MRLDFDDIADLDPKTVNRYIYILSQYITFLNQQLNFYKIKERRLRKEYDRLTLTLASEQQAKTLKERKMLATNHPKVRELEHELDKVMDLREALEDSPKYHIEILNALKRLHNDLVDEARRLSGVD